MPDILSIVSKAVFEKAAAGVRVGDVWATDAYVSTNKGLDPLATGGALFLVTVRPGIELWLVAILEQPKPSRGAWRAATNAVPITDVTALISEITFANGKGIVRDDKLGMSLQTPRELSAASGAALRAVARREVKPAGIPDDATWDGVNETWDHGVRDAHGARQGLWRTWRAAGPLLGECPFVDDEPHGQNKRFHPDGSIASEGTWKNGVLYSTTFHRAAGATDQDWAPDGGPLAQRIIYSSSDGTSNETIRFYDAEGRLRDRAGVMVPPLPEGLPATARYFSDEDFHPPDGSMGGWVDGRIERGTGAKIGRWRWWTTKGALLRSETYTERGKLLGIIEVGKADPTEVLLARLADGDDGARYDLKRRWTPEFHAVVRERLPAMSRRAAAIYIEMLRDGTEEYYRIWTARIAQPRRIIEVVADLEARLGDARPVEAWYLYGAGIEAALEVRARELVTRWSAKLEPLKPPPEELEDKPYSFMRRALDPKKGTLRGEATAFLRGAGDKAVAAIRAAVGKKPASVSDEDLATLCAAEVGCVKAAVHLRDPNTGEAWLDDDEGRSHYFDGKAFRSSEIVIDARAKHDIRYVNARDACDERVVMWPGKHGWCVLQRYGRAVHWHQARYESSRGQAEVDKMLWLRAPSPEAARRIMDLVRAAQPKAVRTIDPWRDSKLGVIVRQYSGDGLTSVGVFDNKLITGPRLVETLASHEAAVRAFERLEIERLRNGSVLKRFSAVDKPLSAD